MTNFRSCGECQECCVVFEIGELKKPVNALCPHQCSSGCGLWGLKSRPNECTDYMCMWVPEESGMPVHARPDKTGLLVDNAPAFNLYWPDTALLSRTIRVIETRPGAAVLPGNARVIEAISRNPTVLAMFCRSWGTHGMNERWLLRADGRVKLDFLVTADAREFYVLPEHRPELERLLAIPDDPGRALRAAFDLAISELPENEQEDQRKLWNALWLRCSQEDTVEGRIDKIRELLATRAAVRAASGAET